MEPLAAVKYEYSMWWREIELTIIPVLEELGIGLVAYSPLGRGFLTGKLSKDMSFGENDSNCTSMANDTKTYKERWIKDGKSGKLLSMVLRRGSAPLYAYTSSSFQELLLSKSITHSMNISGTPVDNKRVNQTIVIKQRRGIALLNVHFNIPHHTCCNKMLFSLDFITFMSIRTKGIKLEDASFLITYINLDATI